MLDWNKAHEAARDQREQESGRTENQSSGVGRLGKCQTDRVGRLGNATGQMDHVTVTCARSRCSGAEGIFDTLG